MVAQDETVGPDHPDFYSAQYARFASDLARAMRREVYGEDMGQQGWRSIEEQNAIADFLIAGPHDHILDVGCGSGGPSLALVERTGGRLTGVDVEAAAIAFGQAEAKARGLADRATFKLLGGDGALPFSDGGLDSIVCIDVIAHINGDRAGTLAGWARLLRPGGRLVFTDPAVVTGAITKAELDIRASIGFFMCAPVGVNEAALQSAGLTLVRSEDRTAAIAEIAARWHEVRARHTAVLEREEGAAWFGKRQRFLATTAELARSRRLSRLLYFAEKPA